MLLTSQWIVKMNFWASMNAGMRGNMKFKTRLRIAFASIVFLPLILTALAFLAISVYLVQDDQPHFFGQVNYAEMVDSVQSVAIRY